MQIDAHLHLWRRARGDYAWLTPALGPLWRDFEAEDAEAELTANGVDRAILVQAAPTVEETRFLLEIAERTPWVAGVVGWVDLEADDVGRLLAEAAATPLLCGVRPMVQDEPDDRWLLRPTVLRGLAAVADAGLTFDAVVRPHQLPAVAEMIARHPDLTVVLDHGGKPDLSGVDLSAWRRDVRRIASSPRVFCKLSGLVTECGGPWTIDQLRRAYETVLDAFGPQRMIWGSDWPVCTLAATYAAWRAAAHELTAAAPAADRAAIFGATARRAYRLNEREQS